jgi:hypothetical protein
MENRTHSLSLRCILESGLCAMAMGSYATILLDGAQAELTLDNAIWGVVLGAIFTVVLSPICCGFIPLNENFSNHLDAWPAIFIFGGLLLATAASQTPRPETAASIRLFGPLCRVLLRIYRYACYLWLIFIPVGTVIGIACIMYLRRPEEPSKQRVDNEPPDTVITSVQPMTHEQPRSS